LVVIPSSSIWGDAGAMLVVDETGDVKKGAYTVGVQHTGTPGSRTRRSRRI
jgi:hypothetical protein